MRKSKLTDQSLYKAFIEMSNGLIDADLGKGVLKKEYLCQAGENEEAREHYWLQTRKIVGYFYMGFKKMSAEISLLKS